MYINTYIPYIIKYYASDVDSNIYLVVEQVSDVKPTRHAAPVVR
jgi:hypothetical protein